MIEQFDGKNIDGLMKIWRDNNLRFQGFVDKQYWIDRYVETRDEFLKNKIYVYTEMGKVLAFIVFGENGTVLNIQVRPEIQREGIFPIRSCRCHPFCMLLYGVCHISECCTPKPAEARG